MEWIYLSPHFDDAALSSGGLIWEQSQAGEQVSIWTICAGVPQAGLSDFAAQKHTSWEIVSDTVEERKEEDMFSCSIMGAETKYYHIPDCIYRRHPVSKEFLYNSEESLWNTFHPSESYLVEQLSSSLAQNLPEKAEIVAPLSLGEHVDHILTRKAAEMLKRPLWYYADFPYVAEKDAQLAQMRRSGWISVGLPVSEQGLLVWQRAVAAHKSQLSTFWKDEGDMKAALRDYRQKSGGAHLWRNPLA